ncbi:plasmid mobilization relaxosome protein MobC [Flavobacterium sp. F-392]|uniref:Plasmid mobilization relaxosome protein MobC n=2 Tax=Flavobacterium muglaense TaxID=2764716 RepID=A0A923MW35_9FLAO|nr:plasmid mobilization relaxosome protein MobC [Flavobacterium muglaense]MBC5843348.1 plasmid mobilization relaxosome protein MobC [Flavobacterium muglaense]
MKEQNNNRNKWLHLRLKPEEYQKIHRKFSKSTCRKLSEYARKNLLEKPLTMNYRNQSLDEFMTEMIHLRRELNALGNNFNQAVKKLHTLQQIAEFKAWILSYELEKKKLFNTMEEIKIHIRKISEKWLQS